MLHKTIFSIIILLNSDQLSISITSSTGIFKFISFSFSFTFSSALLHTYTKYHTGQTDPTTVIMREINLVIMNHKDFNLQAVKNQLT